MLCTTVRTHPHSLRLPASDLSDDTLVHIETPASSHTDSFLDSDSHEATGGLVPKLVIPRRTSVCRCPPLSTIVSCYPFQRAEWH